MSQAPFAVGALVVAIVLADSLNPSTVAPAVALAIQENGARRAAAFAAGVGGVSLLGGLILVAGPGEAIMAALPHPGHVLKEIGELALGLVLLALAAAAWLGRKRMAASLAGSEEKRSRGAGTAAALALGAGIMAIELPTAFPYFGAIAAIVGTRSSVLAQMLLVVLFNLALILPLLVIVGVRLAAGDRAAGRLERMRGAIARGAGTVLAVVLGAGGVALVAVGLGIF